MRFKFQIRMNSQLFIKDPEQSELGRNILQHGVALIRELGFEDFTFKKLAQRIGTTEASIYRYFENKHRLLTYLITWFWTWKEYQLIFQCNNIGDPKMKIEVVLKLLAFHHGDALAFDHINDNDLHHIAIAEGDKAYLTKHVSEDNEARLFKPYKDLCNHIASILLEYNPSFEFPHSLASALVETAHHQLFFKEHLPSLTDFGGDKENDKLYLFLKALVFGALERT